MKKFALRLVLLLILCSMLVSLPQINMVKASETIYIRSDGTIKGTDKIQRDGNIYTFTENIMNQSIVVERDNIVVDGAAYTLQGARWGNGILMLGRSNVTIKNVQIRSFRLAIDLESSSDNIICGNNITENPVGGIGFWKSSNNTISENYIANSWVGIYLQGSLTIRSDHNSIV